jgi:O-antigen/teichoic acid export membrane protein
MGTSPKRHSLLRLILLYTAATGFQRAIVFLVTPLVGTVYALAELGTYTLVQTISQFAVPFLTLNAAVALTRESCDRPGDARLLLKLVCKAVPAIGSAAFIIGYFGGAPLYLIYGFAIGAAEALFASGTAVLQGREASKLFVSVALSKSIRFVIVILGAPRVALPLEHMIQAQLANSLLHSLLVLWLAFKQLRASPCEPRALKRQLKYSAATLPHTIGLWVTASADRLVIAAVLGGAAVGAYSVPYTIGQVMLLFVSGLITAIPPRISSEPEKWRDPAYVRRFISFFGLGGAVVASGLVLLVAFDSRFLGLIPGNVGDSGFIVAGLATGFFSAFYYVFFASYMYLNRDTSALAIWGPFVAVVGGGLCYGLVVHFGITGASYTQLTCYILFATLYGRKAVALEPSLRSVIPTICQSVALVLICSLLTAWATL